MTTLYEPPGESNPDDYSVEEFLQRNAQSMIRPLAAHLVKIYRLDTTIDDLTQETYSRILTLQNRPKFLAKDNEARKASLCVYMKNIAKEMGRERSRSGHPTEPGQLIVIADSQSRSQQAARPASRDVEKQVLDRLQAARTLEVLASLHEDDQVILIGIRWFGIPQKTMAEELGIKFDAFRKRLERSTLKLRAGMTDWEEPNGSSDI